MLVKIRIEGTPEEAKAIKEELKKIYHVLSESKPYKNSNSEYIRIYLDVEGKAPDHTMK